MKSLLDEQLPKVAVSESLDFPILKGRRSVLHKTRASQVAAAAQSNSDIVMVLHD